MKINNFTQEHPKKSALACVGLLSVLSYFILSYFPPFTHETGNTWLEITQQPEFFIQYDNVKAWVFDSGVLGTFLLFVFFSPATFSHLLMDSSAYGIIASMINWPVFFFAGYWVLSRGFRLAGSGGVTFKRILFAVWLMLAVAGLALAFIYKVPPIIEYNNFKNDLSQFVNSTQRDIFPKEMQKTTYSGYRSTIPLYLKNEDFALAVSKYNPQTKVWSKDGKPEPLHVPYVFMVDGRNSYRIVITSDKNTAQQLFSCDFLANTGIMDSFMDGYVSGVVKVDTIEFGNNERRCTFWGLNEDKANELYVSEDFSVKLNAVPALYQVIIVTSASENSLRNIFDYYVSK